MIDHMHAITMATSSVVGCQMCGCLSPSLTLYISHLRLVHSRDPLFHIVCSIQSCEELYKAFAAYNNHVYRHHRVAIGLEDDNNDIMNRMKQQNLTLLLAKRLQVCL